ncbi:MAG TPA: alanine racemase [Steroidobacteraceae bacterium]|jgi:D-serine deaminase-like pyridoxal phosphate-dependent protein|nr:alanine racemase [Steroidobacteraceae bacterium]
MLPAAFNATPTPSLLIDAQRLDANIQRLRIRLAHLGVPLRPHVKTAKCVEVARRAIADQPGGIVVSTLAEAQWFFERGFQDITYAVGIAPQRLPAAAVLIRQGCRLKLLLDAAEMAREVAESGRRLAVKFPVLLELDSDGERAGFEPRSEQLLECARILDESDGTELAGVLTHAGGSYNHAGRDHIVGIAERERTSAAESAAMLWQAGLPCPIVSVGSTPTAMFGQDFSGVTEVRAGVYMFNDLVMAALGVCTADDIALSVLTTVIGHQRAKGWILIDAGWMALSRDRGPPALSMNDGYGVVCDALSGKPLRDLIVSSANQEHGIVTSRGGDTSIADLAPLGSRLRILPIHACATAGMHDSYGVVDGGGEIVERWRRMRGW